MLRPGRYPSLVAMGMNDRVSSVRAMGVDARVSDDRYAPASPMVYDNRRRGEERLYEVNVTSVRAVVGPAEQRCWVERQPAAAATANVNVGGAAAGAMVGSNIGRNNAGQQAATQDVQRCASQPSQAQPAYWDVTYNFRGQEHRVQMTTQPGATLTVNGQGEPRS